LKRINPFKIGGVSMKHFVFPITALILGVSIIIAAFVQKDTISDQQHSGTENFDLRTNANPNLMTKKQLSEYLQISENSVDRIIENDNLKRAQIGEGVNDTYMFLPYLKIDKQERFLKSEINKWLQYKNDQPN
jgi:predicted DNA-binding transcriptional regulator AlpA